MAFVVVAKHNLAYGAVARTLLAAMFFANKIAHHLNIASKYDPKHGRGTCFLVGQVFFGSAYQFTNAVNLNEKLETLTIDLREAHFWDITGIAVLDKVVLKLRREGGWSMLSVWAGQPIRDRFGVHDKPDGIDVLISH